MFKESYEIGPDIHVEKMTGEKAEREILGSQPMEGYFQYLESEKFEKQVERVSDILIKEGIVEKMQDYYPVQSEEDWKTTVVEYVRNSFLDTKGIKKNLEDEKNSLHKGDTLSFKGMLTEKIGRAVTLNAAVRQMLDISAFNKETDPEKYSEKISTPFTLALNRNIKSILKRKYPQTEFNIEYVPAILEDSRALTYLDGIKAVDAFVVITDSKTGFFRVSFIDFTINPKKTDRMGVDHGSQVLSVNVPESVRAEKKQMVYMDGTNVTESEQVSKTAFNCASSITDEIQDAYESYTLALVA